MRVAVITSSSEHDRSVDRRADAMARFLAARGDTVVRLPTETGRLGLRSRIIPVHMPSPRLPEGGRLGQLAHSPRHLAWALKVAGHLRSQGPFQAVLAADASLSLVAASIFRRRQNTPFAVNLEGEPHRWSLPLLKGANAILVPDEAALNRALALGLPSERLHVCPTPVDPGMGDLRERRHRSRRELGLSLDKFVVLCPELPTGGPAEAAVRTAAQALASHGLFRFLLPEGASPSKGCRGLPEGFDPLLAMAASDAVLLDGAAASAGPPGALVEALAAGKPVMLMAPAESEAGRLLTASEGGSILPLGEGASLQVATFGLWADPRLTARIGMKGQQWVEAHHSVQRSGEVLARVLDTLGAGAPVSPPPEGPGR